jgi:hypothetical protein
MPISYYTEKAELKLHNMMSDNFYMQVNDCSRLQFLSGSKQQVLTSERMSSLQDKFPFSWKRIKSLIKFLLFLSSMELSK